LHHYFSLQVIRMEIPMLVIVDDRQSVAEAFVALFSREGVAATALWSAEFDGWIKNVSAIDLAAVEGFVIGECRERFTFCQSITRRTRAIIIATSEARSLDETLSLFAAGADDVVRKPVHAREILARIKAATRRTRTEPEAARLGEVIVFFDGRDPEVGGEVLQLPRRELRILEYLAGNTGCRVSKSQIFNAVYGLFNDGIDESVIESHISKLRKRLRIRLGYDPIDSKRFLGYRLMMPGAAAMDAFEAYPSSFAQEESGHLERNLLAVQG
jgi:two-component system, OmpR family, flagellar system response regulator FtcR